MSFTDLRAFGLAALLAVVEDPEASTATRAEAEALLAEHEAGDAVDRAAGLLGPDGLLALDEEEEFCPVALLDAAQSPEQRVVAVSLIEQLLAEDEEMPQEMRWETEDRLQDFRNLHGITSFGPALLV